MAVDLVLKSRHTFVFRRLRSVEHGSCPVKWCRSFHTGLIACIHAWHSNRSCLHQLARSSNSKRSRVSAWPEFSPIQLLQLAGMPHSAEIVSTPPPRWAICYVVECSWRMLKQGYTQRYWSPTYMELSVPIIPTLWQACNRPIPPSDSLWAI